MSEGFQFGDIIVLAIIAVVILLRLRSTLGKNDSGISREDYQKRRQEEQERILQMPQARHQNVPMPPKPVEDDSLILADIGEPSVSAGLVAIKAADASFSARHFLTGAKAALEMIIESYSKGDKSALKPLLTPKMFEEFSAEIDRRTSAGIKPETTLVAIDANEIIEASLNKNIARIGVRFTTEQINIERDLEGNIKSGDAGHIEKVIDDWIFERDVKSSNPNWKLADT